MAETMTNQSRPRMSRARDRDVRDLSYLTDLGATRRSHRLFRDLQSFLFPIVVAVCLQSIAYLALYTRTAPNWSTALIVVGILAMVPVCVAVTLGAFRRQDSPIITAAAITAIFFSFAVSFLSAMRVHVSFAGFAAAFPWVMAVMSFANVRFHKRLTARVGLMSFDDDNIPLFLLEGTPIALITDPESDVSKFDTILIEPSQHHTPQWSKLLARCYVSGVDLMPWTRFLEIRQGRVHIPTFDISQLVYSPSQMLYARSKRILDVAAVLITLPVTIPLAMLTAIYILARDGWPVLFIQHRRGFGGRVFRMYKFRTMYKGTSGGATATGDKRIIAGCRLIRKLRLDELPQLYNILIGDMSLIGPRPVTEYVARSSIRREEKYALRSLVQPGITGWAQVTSGYAGTTEEEIEKLAYDLYYMKHLSFDLDLQILFKTVKTVLFGSGAR